MQSTHSYKLFKCKYCPNEFESNRSVVKHIKLNHPGKNAYLCFWPECNYSADSSHDLSYHRKKEHVRRGIYQNTRMRRLKAQISTINPKVKARPHGYKN